MAQERTFDLENSGVYLLIGDYLADENFSGIKELIKDFHPGDLGFLLNLLSDEDALNIFNIIEEDSQSEVIRELNESKQQYMAENLDVQALTKVVNELDSDDGADLVGLMDKSHQEEVLENVDIEGAKEVRELLQHAEDSAGGLMSKEVVSLDFHSTVENAIQEIRKAVEDTEQIYNVFITESQTGKLLGRLPLGTLVLARPGTLVKDIMEDVTSVTTTMDQEDVAKIAKKYDMVEIPVVDKNNHLVGRITHDDILDVIEEEAEEDIAHLSGTGNEDVTDQSTFEISRKRLTWLVVGLIGGILSAFIMSQFEMAMGEILLLAFFVPVIMAMGGIVGIQSSTITVRGLATGEILAGQLNQRVFRELGITLITGTICSLLLAITISLWQGNFFMGFTVGISMFCVMIMSTLSGTTIPLLFNRINVDPALATGPFVTTLNDVVGLGIYFGLSTIFLGV